jgi:ketosteroid isomerase-like protein
MRDLEERLDPRRFVRIHRSTIVNVDFIIVLCASFVACTPGAMRSTIMTHSEAEPGADRVRQLQAFATMTSAVNAGDAGRYASVYAANAVITIHGGGMLTGRDAIERYELDLLREFPSTRFAIYSVWLDGLTAVVHYGVNSPAPGNRTTGHEGLLFYRFLPSGLIAEERRYLDSMTPMAQMGMFGTAPVRQVPVLPRSEKTQTATHSDEERRNVEIVAQSFEALNQRNSVGFLAEAADNVVLDELIDPAPIRGLEPVKLALDSRLEGITQTTTEIASIMGAGDAVLAEIVLRGRLNGRFGRTSASNHPFMVHRAFVVLLEAGKIKRVTAFMNGRELAESVGQWPP